MSLAQELVTDRLRLRRWLAEDREPFAMLNANPRVAEHFSGTLTRDESDALAARISAHFEQHGFGMWAVEIPGVVVFAGFIGLSIPRVEAHFTPCVEIGWRLAVEHWGRGYATEGARERRSAFVCANQRQISCCCLLPRVRAATPLKFPAELDFSFRGMCSSGKNTRDKRVASDAPSVEYCPS